jgi:hypothetical protein
MNTNNFRGMRKDLRQIAITAAHQGWRVTRTGGGHLRWTSPTGAPVFSGSTLSDHRALRNIEMQLRKHGFVTH